jgi:four helix bundle protein
MKGQDISLRLLDWTAAVMELTTRLPKTDPARHIGKQLLRASRSAGANYEEARSAESRADFIHKVSLAAKEAREATYWLRLVQRLTLVEHGDHSALCDEGNELVAIFTASAKTARRNLSGSPT